MRVHSGGTSTVESIDSTTSGPSRTSPGPSASRRATGVRTKPEAGKKTSLASSAGLGPFAGPVIGVGERESSKVAGGANDGKVVGYSFDAQQQTGAFDYASLGACGLSDGYLYDSTLRNTTITFNCNSALLDADSPTPTRSELQIDGANAYDPSSAATINPGGAGMPSLTETYTLDKATGNVVVNETAE